MMKFGYSILFLLGFSCFALGVVFEEPKLCCGWKKFNDVVDANSDVKLTFLCNERNLDELRRVALDVSDPQSPRYGKHLTREEVDSLTAPADRHIELVQTWLGQFTSEILVSRNRSFTVSVKIRDAERILRTRFKHVKHAKSGKVHVRASRFELPGHVAEAVSAVFGLHGLPLTQPKKHFQPKAEAGVATPPDVTPKVIAEQYGISGVTASGSTANRQAVAEFQGQAMLQSDLTTFFTDYVPTAKSGDDRVYKLVGTNGTHPGMEASLDIQYIMGVAPGIKTEFWGFQGTDFCGDIISWTSTLLEATSPPLVNSVSYGIQSNISAGTFCPLSQIDAIDSHFAALAARGVSVIFASGDSGAGEVNPTTCDTQPGYQLLGSVYSHTYYSGAGSATCCSTSEGRQFTFSRGKVNPPLPPVSGCSSTTAGKVLEGEELVSGQLSSQDMCCMYTTYFSGVAYTFDSDGSKCTIYSSVTGAQSGPSTAESAVLEAALDVGNCTIYSSVVDTVPAASNIFSTTSEPQQPVLYPSWPASSPWVTSVGATAFASQTPGPDAEEMAVTQFGSGGGFSWGIARMPNASWQEADVDSYLSTVNKSAPPFPGPQSYHPSGRATPDVSAFGEGFQVIYQGKVEGVGGTSAATPTFAAVVSLLNEARLQAGKGSLGFLNPWLYAHSDALTDITLGTNAISRGGSPYRFGYNCTQGWDPATGLGTPIFSKLLSAALATP